MIAENSRHLFCKVSMASVSVMSVLSVLLMGCFAQGGRDTVLFTVLSPVVTILSDASFELHGCYSE